jgi:hypothetical protein
MVADTRTNRQKAWAAAVPGHIHLSLLANNICNRRGAGACRFDLKMVILPRTCWLRALLAGSAMRRTGLHSLRHTWWRERWPLARAWIRCLDIQTLSRTYRPSIKTHSCKQGSGACHCGTQAWHHSTHFEVNMLRFQILMQAWYKRLHFGHQDLPTEAWLQRGVRGSCNACITGGWERANGGSGASPETSCERWGCCPSSGTQMSSLSWVLYSLENAIQIDSTRSSSWSLWRCELTCFCIFYSIISIFMAVSKWHYVLMMHSNVGYSRAVCVYAEWFTAWCSLQRHYHAGRRPHHADYQVSWPQVCVCAYGIAQAGPKCACMHMG